MGDFVTFGVMGGEQIASAGKMIETRLDALQFPPAAANAVILLGVDAAHHRRAEPHRRHPQGALSHEREAARRRSTALAAVFAVFVLFLYGPMIIIFILSFQGPNGGLTFPMNGVSLHWFERLWQGGGIVDISGAFERSLELGLVVMILTVVLSLMRRPRLPQALRRRERAVLRHGRQPDRALDRHLARHRAGVPPARRFSQEPRARPWIADGLTTTMGMFTSGLGAHLTWTLPFGLLVMFAIFNRFDPRYEEAARDLGATPWQTLRHVVLPIILPSVIGVGLFGFTLSWDEIARSSQAMGEHNTLPMELQALTTTVTTPDIYALGTSTTARLVRSSSPSRSAAIAILRARQARHGSDAGQA